MVNGVESRKVEITLNSAVSHVPTLQPILVGCVTFCVFMSGVEFENENFKLR